jgi:hypothetical protein
MRLSHWTCRALTALIISGIPSLGGAAVTLTVKDSSGAIVCTPDPNNLAATNWPIDCPNSKLRFTNSGGSGAIARVDLDDFAKDMVQLTNAKILATQSVSNYTILIQATGLATPPDGTEVWYRTWVKGTASQSASFSVSTQVTNSTGNPLYTLATPTLTPAPITGTFNSAIAAKKVTGAITGLRNITMTLKIINLGQNGSINIGSNYVKIQNQDAPDPDPDGDKPRGDLSTNPLLEQVIKAAGREACLGIYSPPSGCYGVYIK